MPLWERAYCWVLILVGVSGGGCSTATAVINIVTSQLSRPCYLSQQENITMLPGPAIH